MKPFAVIVADEPTFPLVGLGPVEEAVTEKLAPEVAELVPSETTTDCAPLGSAGMVKVTVELAWKTVVQRLVIVAGVPPTVTVSAWLPLKPLALIVADEPTLPLVGLSPLAEAVTEKLAPEVAELVPSETTTDCAPLGSAGIVKVTVE